MKTIATSLTYRADQRRLDKVTMGNPGVDAAADRGLDRFSDRVELSQMRDLSEVARLGREIFERPASPDLQLGAGASALDQLGAPRGDARAAGLLDISGAQATNRSKANPLRPSLDLRDAATGIASDYDKNATVVPGTQTSTTSQDGRTTRRNSTLTDGAQYVEQTHTSENGTVSKTHNRSNVDGTTVTTTDVEAADGRSFRLHEETDAEGRTEAHLSGDRELFYSYMTNPPQIDQIPREDQAQGGPLPPNIDVEFTPPPKSNDRVRPSRDGAPPRAPRLRINWDDLVRDPQAREAAVDMERLRQVPSNDRVLPPRPGSGAE